MNSIWSRDGRRIAYLWYGKDDILELRVYDLKDSSIRTLHRNKTPQDWVQAMDWSPDGRHILTAYWTEATPTGDRESRLGLVSIEDNSVKELQCHFTTLLASDIVSSFSFSPDGRSIAYDAWPSAEEAGKSDIFLISLEDGTEERLVEHPAHDVVVGWAPDGQGLLFTSDRTGSQDLWLLPMSDGRPSGRPPAGQDGYRDHRRSGDHLPWRPLLWFRRGERDRRLCRRRRPAGRRSPVSGQEAGAAFSREEPVPGLFAGRQADRLSFHPVGPAAARRRLRPGYGPGPGTEPRIAGAHLPSLDPPRRPHV